MTQPLMPKATAVWLIENTTLTFSQIAEFCSLHQLEVQGIADGDVAHGVIGVDPVAKGMTTHESIEAAEKDEKKNVEFLDSYLAYVKKESKRKKAKYTPVARRQDKPDAIAWLVKNHPELSDAQISKLVGTTKKTIEDIRNRTYWNTNNLRPRDPVLLGICTQTALQAIIDSAKAKEEAEKVKKEKEKAKKAKAKEKAKKETATKKKAATKKKTTKKAEAKKSTAKKSTAKKSTTKKSSSKKKAS